MDNLTCPATDRCERICDALSTYGVEKTEPHTFEHLYQQHDTGSDDEASLSVAITLPETVQPEHSVVAAKLLEALYPLISGPEKNTEDVERIAAQFESVLDARMKLWQMMGDASRAGREFVDVELKYYEEKIQAAEHQLAEVGLNSSDEAIMQAQAAFDARTLRKYDLVFDRNAIDVLDRLAVNGMVGEPTLLVGDKGLSKTRMARFMAEFMSGDAEPVFMSGHGDQTSDEFIGRDYQDPDSGLFVFKHGKLIDAMRHGLPVIIDEINLADQSITMRLQDILLKKPGDTIVLHENGNEEITIAPGFVVFATANEASERYRHRVTLDPAFRDRFDTVSLEYPDSDTASSVLDVPADTFRLAFAAASESDGTISPHISINDLHMVVRVAHVTQRLYSRSLEDAGDLGKVGLKKLSTSQALLKDKPVMTDCITPRKMIRLLKKCVAGNKPGVSVWGELQRAIRALDQSGAQINGQYAQRIVNLYRGETK